MTTTSPQPAGAGEQAARQVLCDHCGLHVPKGLIEPDSEQQFCCNGCRTVYDMIHANGLDRYYRLRQSLATGPLRAAAKTQGYAALDNSSFLDKQTREAPGGLRIAELRLEGVHCAACLWLVERLPEVLSGVVDAKLNLRGALVRVTWDPAVVPLSKVAETLDRLGYPAYPAGDVSAQQVRRQEQRRQLLRLGVAGALAGNTMLIALALYAGLFTGIESQFVRLFSAISAGLGVLSIAWPGAVFFRGAWASIVTRRPNLDLPIALALAVGGLAGLVNTVLGVGDIYFDSLSVLVFLLLVGRWFQARQQRWADEAVGLMFSFTPAVCRVVRDDQTIKVPIDTLTTGDVVEVRSGELLPADGRVLSGESSINQALLTGEADAVAVGPNDKVFAGTQNLGSLLRVRVSEVGEATRVGGLMRLVDQGVRAKSPIVQFTDRAAGWFVAAVVIAATATLAFWWTRTDWHEAVGYTVALLIVACPCALGLATPLTMALALGIASRRNMLVKNAGALETLAGSGRMLLDKTGTLTLGRPAVVRWEGPEWLGPVVSLAERESRHPIAVALHQDLVAPDVSGQLSDECVTHIVEHGDGGVSARVRGQDLLVGCLPYFERLDYPMAPEWLTRAEAQQSAGRTVVLVGLGGSIVALAALQDRLRGGVRESVAELNQLGWRPEILSGDAPAVVARVAAEVGLPNDRAAGSVTPEDKLTIVKSGKASTVMVGDGVNDAAALAAADVGIAVHGGAEASLAAADVYLAQPGLEPLVDLVRHSRRTMRVVRRNLAISLVYNAAAVTLAACGLITPLVAAVLMPLSSAAVLGSAAAGFRKG